jgi:hypothetical protein
MRFPHFIFGLIFSVAAVACGHNKHIPERELVKILAEMHLADAVMEITHIAERSSWATDSTAVYTAILDRYGYTAEQLYNTVARYNGSIDNATKLYDKVNKQLEKLQSSANSKVEALRRQQNRWTEKSEWTLPNDGDTSRLPFSIPAEGLGEYILEATVALYSADSVNHPRMTMYLYAAASDSVTLRVEQEVQRNEAGQAYSLSIVNRDAAVTHVRGYIFDRDVDSLGSLTRHAAAKNIMLRFLPSNEPTDERSAVGAPVDTSPPVRVSVINAQRPLPHVLEEW